MPTDANTLIQNDYRPISGWSLLRFLAVCVAAYLGLAVVVFFLRPQLSMLTALSTFFVIGLAGVVVAVAPLGKQALPALGLRSANWKYPVFGALGTVALSVAVSQFGVEPQGMKQVLQVVREPHELAVSLLAIGVLAPIAEELVFRGLLYGWIAGRWGGTAGLVVSSLAFAAAHYEPAHIILVLPLGFLFGWLRRRSDSLVPSLCSHIVNNSFALLAAVYLPGV